MKRFLFPILFFIFGSLNVNAVYISELMYDPSGSDTGREWVEIYNDTGSGINFTTWKFFESNVNHGISSYSSSTNVSPNSYAIIADNPAKFLLDFPNFSGVLYDSSFSLSNSGELLILKDQSLSQIDSVNYSTSIGGNDDGSTLSFATSSFVRGKATPGQINIEEQKVIATTDTSSISQITSAPASDILFLIPEIKTVLVGADTDFSVKTVTASSRKNIDGLNYTWNFGDGGTRIGKNVSYHYFYPGNYIITVKAEGDGYLEKEKFKVIAISPNLEIINTGYGEGGAFIDIRNNNKSEIDLSNWIIETEKGSYVLKEGTIILSNSVTRLSGNALLFSTSTNELFTGSATSTIRILYPDNTLFTKYEINKKNDIKENKIDFVSGATTSISKILNNKNTQKKIFINSSSTKISQNNSTSTKMNNGNNGEIKKDKRFANFLKSFFR